jgi:hypothetical protein
MADAERDRAPDENPNIELREQRTERQSDEASVRGNPNLEMRERFDRPGGGALRFFRKWVLRRTD